MKAVALQHHVNKSCSNYIKACFSMRKEAELFCSTVPVKWLQGQLGIIRFAVFF